MEFDKKHAGKKKEDTLSRKHWSLECHESLILRNEDGFFALILKGGAEEGLFPLIGDVKQKKINYHSGKVFQGELILEVNKMRVPGLTRKDVAALIRRSSEPLVIVTVKQNSSITRNISEYLTTRYTKSGVDKELQQQIRRNLHTKGVPSRKLKLGERTGVEFTSTEEFKELEASGSLLERGMFEGTFCGTPKPSGNPPPLDGGSEEHRTNSPSKVISQGAMLNNVALGPLPANWKMVCTEDGQKYFIEPNAETTHWIDPHLSCVQKQDPGKCDDDASTKRGAAGTSPKPATSGGSSPKVAKTPPTCSPPEVTKKQVKSPKDAAEASAELAEATEQHSEVEVAELRQQLDLQNLSVQELKDKYTHIERELEHIQSATELKCHQATEREREKWEAREERLLEQLNYLQLCIKPPAKTADTAQLTQECGDTLSKESDDKPTVTTLPSVIDEETDAEYTSLTQATLLLDPLYDLPPGRKPPQREDPELDYENSSEIDTTHEKASIARRPPVPAPYGTDYTTPLVDSPQQTDLNSNRNRFHFDGENGFGKRMVQPRGPRKEPAHWQSWQFHTVINQS